MSTMLTPLRNKRVVVLPDLYVDTFVPLPRWQEATARLGQIAERGGGNLPVGPIHSKVGGNATNLAIALSRLGASVHLIAETDALGRFLLDRAPAGPGLRLDRVRVGADQAATVALEAPDANVMLSHAGPVLRFGPQQLDAEDLACIADADAVACVNWAQNQDGTALIEHLGNHLRDQEALLYVDTGDPTHRLDDAQRFVASASAWKRVDVWALNDNELHAFSRTTSNDDPIAAARALAQRLDVRLDLHTRDWAASVPPVVDAEVNKEDADPAPARRLTGAGDTWNAGNLAGYLLGWDDRSRLRLAHEVATRYVTSEDGSPPLAEDITTPLHPISK